MFAIAAPWFLYMYWRFGDAFVAGYVPDENLKLYATARFGRPPSAWFYFQILAAGLLPWTGVVIGRLLDDVRRMWGRRSPDTLDVMLWAWTAAVVGFFTLSQFKLDHYVFPAGPALCLLCARAWNDVRSHPSAPENKYSRIGFCLVGPLLVAVGFGGGFLLIARLELPRMAIVVPAAMALAGVVITIRSNFMGVRSVPKIPWIALTAVTITYAGIVFWVLPALESRKVVPDLARWVAAHAEPGDRIASYRLNRWNTAFRYYVDSPTTIIEAPAEAEAFFGDPEPFFCVMLEPAYQEFVARGMPLTVVYRDEGMWATSGRVLWKRKIPPTRFLVVTRERAGLLREVERHAGDDGVRPEEQRALDQQRRLVVQQVLPPARGHELRQDDGHVVVGPLGLDLLDVFEQRLHHRSERRRQDDQLGLSAPRFPGSPDLLGPRRVQVHVNRPHIVGQRFGVAQRLDHRALDAADRDEHGVVHAALRRVALQGQLRPDVIVVAARRLEDHHDHRNQQQDDPRALERLGDRDDDQHDAGDDGAEAVDERALVRQPGSPELRQWITIPACDSVNEMNTPIM